MPGSSTAVKRAVISDRDPDRDAGEINDKGHLVQRRCLANRSDLVAQFYADAPDTGVITPRQTSDAAE